MCKKTFLAVAAAILFGATTAVSAAESVTAESSLKIGAEIITNARNDQQTWCEHPRVNTVERCRADFEDLIKIEIEHTARHVLYLLAQKRGDKPGEIKRLKSEWASPHNVFLDKARMVDRNYTPLPKAGAK